MKYGENPERSKIRIAIISGALSALLVSATFFTPLFKINHVKVNLNSFTTEREILESAHIKYGETILPFLSEKKVIKRLKSHPYVLDAKLKKRWPQKIIIDIKYRNDSFAIPNAGFYIVLDDQLQVLRVDKMAYDATILEGLTFKEFKIGKRITVDQYKILEQIVKLKQLMNKSHIAFLAKIDFSNDCLIVYTKQGLKASFGDGKNAEMRFNNFAEIYDNLNSKKIKSGLIDVSSDGLPIYKPFGN